FWVTDYRVDNDYASAPPPEITALAPSMPAAAIAGAAKDSLPGSGRLNPTPAQAEPGAAAETTRAPATAGPRLVPGNSRP
ncbi:MAG TPA: hypothetical protein VN614_03625, partial [Rhodanobacter sp.]|nr:hypothetical protein [Rhodanobacter sp.]